MAGGTGAGVNGGGRKVGEPGQANFWVLGFRIGVVISSMYKEDTNPIQPMDRPRPSFQVLPFHTFHGYYEKDE